MPATLALTAPDDQRARFLLRIVIPALAAVLALGAVLAAVLVTGAMQANNIAGERQQELVATVLRQSATTVAHDQEAVTIWDDALLHVNAKKRDLDWLDWNMGAWVHNFSGHDDAFILDPKDRPIYAMRDGRRAPVASYDRDARPAAEPLIREMRAKLDHPSKGDIAPAFRSPGAVDFAMVGGHPSIVSVKPIIDGSISPYDAPDTRFLHISVRHLDGSFVDRLASQYQLEGARFSRDPPVGTGERAALLTNRAGTRLGYFVWRPFGPGAMMVRRVAPPAAAAFLLIFIMVGWLLQRIRRSTLQLEASKAQAQHLAFHDPLTGLANRALFNERLTRALAEAHRSGASVALLYLDLDRFKNVNDTLGHPAGDELVSALARRLIGSTRAEDVVARVGGDEFAIIQTGLTSPAQCEILCMRIMEALADPFMLAGNAVSVGISIGVAIAPRDAEDRTELTRKADIALYEAKSAGRGRYVFFHDEMDASIRHRERIERDLRAALDAGDQFELVYQPLYSAQSKQITGAEALIRWHHPELGLLAPALFIPIAEATGLVEPIGQWVLEQACSAARHWPIGTISVNISAVQLRNENFARDVLATLERTGLDPSRLELEITETSFIESAANCGPNLARLRQYGVRIALDDFGTGYSSFTHLQQFEVDRIKIDQSFVQGLDRGDGGNAIIRAIVDLARASGMQVTAEGVETAEQDWFLTHAGCNALQGYLLSTPVSASRLDALLGIGNDRVRPLSPRAAARHASHDRAAAPPFRDK